jgi:hypothetical protein
MKRRHWWLLGLGLALFYLLAFEVPGWIAGATRAGLTPWNDF